MFGGSMKTFVANCSFRFNRENGLSIYQEKLSRSETNASKFSAINCDIHSNRLDGIKCVSSNLALLRNTVYCSARHEVRNEDGQTEMKKNIIFDNGSWGIIIGCDSACNVSLNRVLRNNSGGIRTTYLHGDQGKKHIIIGNIIHDNGGPGFVENNLRKSPDTFKSTEDQYNKFYNNVESKTGFKWNFSVLFCSQYHKKCTLSRREKCFTAAYCSPICEERR